MHDLTLYPEGFEEDGHLRSAFIRGITLLQLGSGELPGANEPVPPSRIPRTLIRYWHDPADLPDDVRVCLNSWDRLTSEGFELYTFNDISAAAYIQDHYSELEMEAFALCRHPAMRSDYLRMCFLLKEGGLYVDADDVLLGDGWKALFLDSRLKVQPLCYDIEACGMVPAFEIWKPTLPTDGRIFYVNNDPIAAPANHPILGRALSRATIRLLSGDPFPEIQATTGPGNLTSALAWHARDLQIAGASLDFQLLHNWEAIAETRWELSYRNDARNWRNMGGG
jgi:hypothetical protein